MKDKNGQSIEVGTNVLIEAVVTEVHATDDECYLTLHVGEDSQKAPIIIRYPFNIRPDLVEVKG